MQDSTELPEGEITVGHKDFIKALKFLGKNTWWIRAGSVGSAISSVNSSEVKQRSERSQIFH